MYDKDSQLIYEAYTTSMISEEEERSANIDPLTWTSGDIVTLKIGSFNLDFYYRGYQPSRNNKEYFHNYQPVKDYTEYGALPNISTGEEGSQIIYKQNNPINVEADVIRKGKANRYGHTTKVVGYKATTPGGGSASPAAAEKSKAPSRRYFDVDAEGEAKMRWTQDPEHRHSFRAAAADWKPFERSDVKTMPMKHLAGKLERGWQRLLAPKHDVKRQGASRFATDPSQQYTGPSTGDRKWMGSEYEGPAKKTRRGASKQATS